MHSHGLPGPSGKPSLLHSFCRLCDCPCSIQTGCSKALGALGSSSERPQGYGELQLSEGPTFRWLGCKPDDAACAQRQDAGHRAIDGAILMRLQADRPGSITIVLHLTVAMQAKYEKCIKATLSTASCIRWCGETQYCPSETTRHIQWCDTAQACAQQQCLSCNNVKRLGRAHD